MIVMKTEESISTDELKQLISEVVAEKHPDDPIKSIKVDIGKVNVILESGQEIEIELGVE